MSHVTGLVVITKCNHIMDLNFKIMIVHGGSTCKVVLEINCWCSLSFPTRLPFYTGVWFVLEKESLKEFFHLPRCGKNSFICISRYLRSFKVTCLVPPKFSNV